MTDALDIGCFDSDAAEGLAFSCTASVVPSGRTFSFAPMQGTDGCVTVFALQETAMSPWHIDEEFLRTSNDLFISVVAKIHRVFRCILRPFRRVLRKIATPGRLIFARICGLRI